LSQRILNELSAAKLCLLNPQEKAAYDRQLRQSLEPAVSAPPTVPQRPRPLPQARPLVAEQPVPLIVPDTGTTSSPVRRARRKTPFWLQPGVLGTIGAALVLVLVAYYVVTVRQASTSPEMPKATSTAANQKTPPRAPQPKEGRPARSVAEDRGTKEKASRPEAVDLKIGPAEGRSVEVKPPLSLVAGTSPPETPGVIADRVVLWNQHNGNARDRGTRECRLSLWRDGSEIWKKDAVQIPWTPDGDENVSVSLPSVRFDRLRVGITKWENAGGGLAEIEVMQGDRNLALGCPALALATFDSRFLAANLTDGVHTSQRGAFWLLPSGMPGWAEVDLTFAQPQPSSGVSADKLVIWNTHNAHHRDRGALACNVRLSVGSEEVWRQDDVAMPWEPNSDGRVEIALPDKPFDRVRIEIPRWQGLGAGLSEVEVNRGDVNLARACPVIASGNFEYPYVSATITDGITTSASNGIGYWLAPDNAAAWAEIDLSWNGAEIGSKSRAAGEYRVLVDEDWSRGLPWLARSEAIELRAAAEIDGRLDQLSWIDGGRSPRRPPIRPNRSFSHAPYIATRPPFPLCRRASGRGSKSGFHDPCRCPEEHGCICSGNPTSITSGRIIPCAAGRLSEACVIPGPCG
jgi:hypothetical protein